jgi:hypothetical protein
MTYCRQHNPSLMIPGATFAIAVAALLISGGAAFGQELEPRAYSISPVGMNFAVVAFTRSTGDINFDPSLPVENAQAEIQNMAFGYFRSIDFFGRSANVSVLVPYTWGTIDGDYFGEYTKVSRSGLSDSMVRFAVNLYGAPAMGMKEFAAFTKKTIIGASVTVSAPLGQYDPARIINLGGNRWTIKPEVGLSRSFGNYFVDVYGGVRFYTVNDDYQGRTRKQSPVGSVQLHMGYNFRPRLWLAGDANFFWGGQSTIDEVQKFDRLENSRAGVTLSVPVDRHNSIKFNVSESIKQSVGGNFLTLGVAYQYIWGGKR